MVHILDEIKWELNLMTKDDSLLVGLKIEGNKLKAIYSGYFVDMFIDGSLDAKVQIPAIVDALVKVLPSLLTTSIKGDNFYFKHNALNLVVKLEKLSGVSLEYANVFALVTSFEKSAMVTSLLEKVGLVITSELALEIEKEEISVRIYIGLKATSRNEFRLMAYY